MAIIAEPASTEAILIAECHVFVDSFARLATSDANTAIKDPPMNKTNPHLDNGVHPGVLFGFTSISAF
jgi:hypothetical protein